ncbi:hypothetical protein HW115_12065 [Verrucomicrobiaceae bacterium N1E253]|uniref:Uncharacterized protein n=1 Tax=Oceaniferula marina TaxID=2748318 RepID=A0A851GGL9_9BACT|nr:hypothetical protein [Oceaniferula marina]NWK56349.1 hypothetical protein [Oceaniferula marina]
MAENGDGGRIDRHYDDLVLERPRRSNFVECTKCGHLFEVSRKSKVAKEAAQRAEGALPLSWKVLLASGSLLVLSIALLLWNFLLSGNEKQLVASAGPGVEVPGGEGSTEGEDASSAVPGAGPNLELALSTADVTVFLREFFKAGNWRERYPMVRQTPQIEEKMQRWYRWNRDGPMVQVAADPRATDLGDFMVVKLHGVGLASEHIVLEKTLAGFRVDWESFVIYQDQAWLGIQKEQPRGARLIRCVLEPTQNTHPEWSAEKGYRCYRLTHPVSGEVFFAYSRTLNENEQDPAARALLSQPKGRFTLEVYYPEKSKRAQDVMISRVVEKGWVIK